MCKRWRLQSSAAKRTQKSLTNLWNSSVQMAVVCVRSGPGSRPTLSQWWANGGAHKVKKLKLCTDRCCRLCCVFEAQHWQHWLHCKWWSTVPLFTVNAVLFSIENMRCYALLWCWLRRGARLEWNHWQCITAWLYHCISEVTVYLNRCIYCV